MCEPSPTSAENVQRPTIGQGGTELTENQKTIAESLVDRFLATFCEDLTKINHTSEAPLFKIDLKESMRRRRTAKLRRRSAEEQKVIQEFLDKMSDANMIEKCVAPAAAPLVLVRQNGKIRVCVDYRELNQNTTIDVHPQARADEILSAFAGAKYFSTLDCTSGYWQVAIDKGSQLHTAFRCAQGTFQWKRLPFGLVNAPAHYNLHRSQTQL